MVLWLQLGLVNQSWMMDELMEHGVTIIGKGKSKYLKETCPNAFFFLHKSHLDCPGIEPGPLSEMLVTSCLSYGMNKNAVYKRYVSWEVLIL
jgi:hypothetical protein